MGENNNKSDSDQIQDVIGKDDSDPTGFSETRLKHLPLHEAAVLHKVPCELDFDLPMTSIIVPLIYLLSRQFRSDCPFNMAEVRALDDYYLAITLLITIAYQLFFFAIAFSLKFDKLTDFAGGTNFVVLAIITLSFSGEHHARQIVTSLFIMFWGARLSGFLLFRILKTGKDDRFDEIRDEFFKFLGFWVFQMFWVWTVSLPVTVLNSPNITKYRQPSFGTGRDIAGVILFTIGFVMEFVSDIQKYLFRSDPANKGKVCDIGFFRWTRHPNYFGEIIMQFSIYMIAISPAAYGYISSTSNRNALYATILGPIFLTLLLLFVSGLTLQERPGAKKRYESGNHWESYQRYTKRTSILIPFPPQLYEPLPTVLKRTVFLEFPLYVFDPAKHADAGKVREREAAEREEQSVNRVDRPNSAEYRDEEQRAGG